MNRALSGCLPYLALSVLGAIVWPFVGGAVLIKLVLAVWIIGFGMVSLASFRHSLESRGKYDLKRLQRVHEREELRKAEAPVVSAQPTEVVCPKCGGASDARYATCPHCGASL